MSDQPPIDSKPAVCDGKDHGVTAERMEQLKAEADAFNRLLQASKFDAKGPDHDAAARQSSADFYKFMPRQPEKNQQSNEGRAFDASKAFYEQLTNLPVGERKVLVSLAQEQNKAMHAQDDGMPELQISMNSHAFIDDVTVKYPWIRARDIRTNEMGYAREYFTFKYRGMCAQYEPTKTADSIPSKNTFFLSLDNWRGISFFHRH
jgi:hypothetical protein